MVKLNHENSNYSVAASGGLASNTRLIPPTTTKTTTLKSFETTDNNKAEQSEIKQKSSGIFHNHLDWLTLNFTKLNQEQFQELTNLTGRGLIVLEQDKAFSQGEKARNYQNTISSPIGLKGAYNSYQTIGSLDTFYDVTISLSGEYFSALTAVEQWELYRDLYINYFPTCSRVDTSIDDYSFENIPLDEMRKAFNDGNYFDFQQYSEETTVTHPDNSTTTHYFGGKGSKRLVRVYKHKNESLRLETQFRGNYAQAAFQALATLERQDESNEEWEKIIQKNIGGIAVGAIDFRDKSKLKNKSKACKSKTNRLSFWQNFIDKIGVMHSIKLQPKQLDLSQHQSMFDWLKKYVSKNLAIAFHVLGKDKFIRYVLKLVEYGETKFTPQDRKRIEYLRSNLKYLDLD